MTASDIKILKTSHEGNQIFEILGLQFRFCPHPAAGEEYPQAAFISTEDEWYQKSKKW